MVSPLNLLRKLVKRPTVPRRGIIIMLVLVCVFSVAIIIRAFPAKYGFFLNEFDPYYDYKAANFIVTSFDNSWKSGGGGFPGLLNYFSWTDTTTWFPEGRQVAQTSQDGLHFAGALLYIFFRNVFGLQMTLYDFLVLLPVFLGAFAAIVFFFLVRRIAGEAAGLFASLIIAVSPPLIERGNLGWFKSEPLAILLFASASYVFLTLFDNEMRPGSRTLRAILAGFLVGYANTSWGGALYFSVAFGLVFLILPFLGVDLSYLAPTILIFTASALFGSAIFPRPGVGIVTNPAGLALIGGTLFVLVAQWSKSWVKPSEYMQTLVKLLFGFVLAGLAVLSFGFVGGISARYLAAIFPWVRTGNPLVASVAEHFVPAGSDYFSSYLIILFFGVFGAIVALRRKNNVPMIYALVIGLTGLYVSAAFSRLLVYSSIALALLAGIGFAELAFAIVKPGAVPLVKKKPVSATKSEMRVIYSVALVALLAFPASIYWIPNPAQCTAANPYLCDQSPADSGVSLSNGGTVFSRSQLNDWVQALQWIRDNTPKNAVIISWWDYGYWDNVMGNRTTVADNATLNGTRIAQIGRMFMSNTTVAATTAKGLAHGRPAYILLFLVGSLISISGQAFYVLQVPAGAGLTAGGGDESKKQWFIRIGFHELNVSESVYLFPPPDDFNLTPFTLQDTIFGQMLPFQFAGYINSAGTLTQTYQLDNKTGAPPIQAFSYPYNFHFSANGPSPFRIAYYSPSLTAPTTGTCQLNPSSSLGYCGSFYTVLIYQVV
ncbi:MAG: hypothetical protein E6K84_01480 [Thaumarchaeota archaeon]|nr:MAG: hypothetical protein E6K84_01480 [Nitrososphaerota archaeon]